MALATRTRTAGVVVALTGAVIVAMDWVPTPLNRNIEGGDAAARIPGTLVHGGACAVAWSYCPELRDWDMSPPGPG